MPIENFLFTVLLPQLFRPLFFQSTIPTKHASRLTLCSRNMLAVIKQEVFETQNL
jgi:hypothetical protein